MLNQKLKLLCFGLRPFSTSATAWGWVVLLASLLGQVLGTGTRLLTDGLFRMQSPSPKVVPVPTSIPLSVSEITRLRSFQLRLALIC